MTKCAAPIDPNSIVIPKKPANKSASEHRKITKPIMEKRRRARINHSLEQLKLILIEQFSECSKKSNNLEKADILEMTVKYLKDITAKQNFIKSQSNLVNHKNSIIIEKNILNHQQQALGEKGVQLIQNGFKDCKQQINQCLSNVDKRLNERLNIHLTKFEKQKFDHGNFNCDQVLNLSIADHHLLNHSQQVNNIILHTPSSACSSSSSTIFFPQSNSNGGSLSPGSERSISPSSSEGPVWRPW